MELYLSTRRDAEDQTSPAASRRHILNSLLSQTRIGEPALNNLFDHPTSLLQRAATPKTIMRAGTPAQQPEVEGENPPPQNYSGSENRRLPIKPSTRGSMRQRADTPASPRRQIKLTSTSPRRESSSGRRKQNGPTGPQKLFAEVLSQKCAVCSEFDRCAFCFRSKLTTQRRMHLEKLGLSIVLQQPEIKALELIKHVCQYARSDTYAKATNEKLAWLEQRVELCETHDDIYISLEEERRAAGSKNHSLQQALNKANKENASLREQLSSMTRMLKAEDLDESEAASELKKTARKNIKLEAEIVCLKEQAASNEVKLLAVDKLQQDLEVAHKNAMESQRSDYDEEVKNLRADLEKDRGAMRHLEDTLHRLHESFEQHKNEKESTHASNAEEDLIIKAEMEAHALLVDIDEEISEARALAVTHGHGTDEDEQIVDIKKLQKHETQELRNIDSEVSFASPYAQHRTAQLPPDYSNPAFRQEILETINVIFIEKLRIDEHDVELGLDPQPFATVVRDVMTHRYGKSSILIEKKIREFVVSALTLAQEGSVRARICCTALGLSAEAEEIYSPHIGDALFDLLGGICERYWGPGTRNCSSKVAKCLLLYPENACIIEQSVLSEALSSNEAIKQYLDPEAMQLMQSHIKVEDLLEPTYNFSIELPESVKSDEDYSSAKEASTYSPPKAGLSLDWYLDYVLKQIIQSSKRHVAFLYRMFNHFAAEDNDTSNMTFSEFGDLIDSCVSDDTEKRKLHRQQ